MSYAELKTLLPRHYRILDLLLEGKSNVEVAEAVGMSSGAISAINASPLFQHELAKRRDHLRKVHEDTSVQSIHKARSILNEAAGRAAGLLSDQVDHADPNVAQRASVNILDRVLGQSKDAAARPMVMITAEKLQLIQQVLREEYSDVPSVASPTTPLAMEGGGVEAVDIHTDEFVIPVGV